MQQQTSELTSQRPQSAKVYGLADRVRLSICRLGYAELGRVQCVAHDGHLTLQGTVTKYFLKQIAQSIALNIEGVRSVTNEINVKPDSQ